MKTVEDHLFRRDRFFMQLWTLSEIQLHFLIKKTHVISEILMLHYELQTTDLCSNLQRFGSLHC